MMMMNKPRYKIGDRNYQVIGVDQFAPDGEIYYITEADCLEDCGEYWSDEEIRYERGED